MQDNTRIKLSDSVVEKLEELISTMKPGERLPTEKELSERFSVGRSTIRESMKMLSARQLVVRRNEGTFVSDAVRGCFIDPLNLIIHLSIGNINSLIELRMILELNTIRLAAERAHDADIIELRRALWLTNEPGLSDEQKQERDIAFHNTIAKIADNPVIEELLTSVRVVIAQNLENNSQFRDALREGPDFHEEMVDAIAAQDPDRAYQCMEKYFEFVYKCMGI